MRVFYWGKDMARPRKETCTEQSELVAMTKAGEVIEVHPSCVKAHEQAGWKVMEGEDE